MTLIGAGREIVPAGVGPDGSMFHGSERSGGLVTIYRLRAGDDAVRRKRARRFDMLGTWAVGRALAFKKVDLAGNIIIVERTARTLAQALAKGPLDADTALGVIYDVARALADLHRAGIVHGFVDAASISLREAPAPFDDVDASASASTGDDESAGFAALDVTGLRCSTRNDPLARLCRQRDEEQRAASDVFSLGALLLACLEGPEGAARMLDDKRAERTTADAGGSLTGARLLAGEMLEDEPAWRPTAADVARRVAALRGRNHSGDGLAGASAEPPATVSKEPTHGDGDDDGAWPKNVGRFEIVDLLGEGAMGRVFKARDRSTAELVALKLVSADPAPTARALKRFKKEARILAEVKNPGVASLVDAGDDNGRLWMAVEYVQGETLSAYLTRKGPLPENEALAVVADLCRALVDVHERGIVHRDVKPDNILVLDVAKNASAGTRVKLIDFGIARHLDETESLAMTRQGAVMGTPLYMAPEQARGLAVDARSDVYALGTVLYELLAGSAPFAGNGAAVVLALQQEKEPPRITEVRREISDEVSSLIARSLEKNPEGRFQNAKEMLAALLRLLHEDPATIAAHPKVPAAASPSRWSFEWDLKSPPKDLWPYVSNTDRLNKAIGLGAVDERVEVHDGDAQQFGHVKQAGFDLRWREHPYEWVLERRIGVWREYSEGPLRSMRSTVDLLPSPSGGTHLVHTIEIDPRGVLGRAAAAVEVGVKTRRALDKVYRRIDDLVAGHKIDGIADVFATVEPLGSAREERLKQLEKKVVEAGADAAVVARLGELIEHAPSQDLARIRPIALARKLGVAEDAMVRACLLGAREGLLVPLWDLLCPSCRAPADIEETLRAVRDHGHCEVCNVDFALDLATSIELVFRVHPQLRQADAGNYCLSSPGKSPHVVAQIRVMPGEHFLVETALPEGNYQITGRRLSFTVGFRVRGAGHTSRIELSLKEGPSPQMARVMRSGKQEIVLHNDTGREQLVRIERTAPRNDVFTAARAAAHPLFREVFPNEILEPGALVKIASVVVLHAELRGSLAQAAADGDPRAFSTLYAAYKAMETAVAAEGGSVVKIMGDGVLAVFDEPAAAVRASWKLNDAVQSVSSSSLVRAAVHRGPAAAVTLNDRLDYFGSSIRIVGELARVARDGGVVVSEEMLEDPVVQEVLDERARKTRLPGFASEEPTAPLAIA